MTVSRLMMPAVTLAGALALAGCGGGNNNTGGSGGGGGGGGGDKTPKEICEERGTGYTYTEEGGLCAPPAPSKSAAAYEGEATAAIAAADKLVADAGKANKALTADKVDGVSDTVMANAVMVRGAPAGIEAEIAKAQAALDALEGRADADSMAAAERVKAHITRLEKLVAPRSAIVRQAAAIKASGTGSPEQRAQAAAMAVHADLSGLVMTPRPAVVPTHASVPATGIFGSGNSRTAAMVRLAGVSMEGLTSTAAFGTSSATDHRQGTTFASGILEAINARCVSADGCKGVDSGGKFGAGWVFSPTDSTTGQNYYTLNEDGTAYELAMFIEWGLWASPGSGNGNLFDLNRFAGSGAGSATQTRGDFAVRTDENGLDAKATYKGTAHGLASRLGPTSDGSARKATQSGQFGATVTITAEFDGTDTEIEGTIDQFTGGVANPNWKVEFKDDDYAGSAVILTDTGQRVTVDNYGAAAERPAGLFGAFEKTWDDGAAAGVYHAPKE